MIMEGSREASVGIWVSDLEIWMSIKCQLRSQQNAPSLFPSLLIFLCCASLNSFHSGFRNVSLSPFPSSSLSPHSSHASAAGVRVIDRW
jgi:hypothetical protein